MTKTGIDNIYDNHGRGAFVEAVRQPGFPATYKFRPWRIDLRASQAESMVARLASTDDFATAEEADRVTFAYVQGPGEGVRAAQWNAVEHGWDLWEPGERMSRGSSDAEDFHSDE